MLSYSLDTRAIGAADLPAFLSEWQDRIGPGFRLPTYEPATMADFRVRFRTVAMPDVLVHRQESYSRLRTADGPDAAGAIVLYILHKGEMVFDAPQARDQHTVPSSGFLLRRLTPSSGVTSGPHVLGTAITLPEPDLGPLLGDRKISGSLDTAEMRLLNAHADMIWRHGAGLSPVGAQAARDALVELAKAVVRGALDHTEPQLTPALVRAAKSLADRRLTDPRLSAATLARALNVSVRTLQRAFAADDESVAAYIRARRLEEARRDLTNPAGRLTITEIAARWQFADSGHFSRAFKQHYGQTPTEYARAATRMSEPPGAEVQVPGR